MRLLGAFNGSPLMTAALPGLIQGLAYPDATARSGTGRVRKLRAPINPLGENRAQSFVVGPGFRLALGRGVVSGLLSPD